jgi:hypothetical protein
MQMNENGSSLGFNNSQRRHKNALLESGRGAPLFEQLGRGSLSIYTDVAIVSDAKSTTEVPLNRLAGVDFARSLPWFGNYRLTFVYLDGETNRKALLSVVMPYNNVVDAIAVLQTLSNEHRSELVVRRERYPIVEALCAAAAFGPIVIFAAGARSGNWLGGLTLALVVLQICSWRPSLNCGIGRSRLRLACSRKLSSTSMAK